MSVLGCEVSDGMVWYDTGTCVCALQTISMLDSVEVSLKYWILQGLGKTECLHENYFLVIT